MIFNNAFIFISKLIVCFYAPLVNGIFQKIIFNSLVLFLVGCNFSTFFHLIFIIKFVSLLFDFLLIVLIYIEELN